MALRSVPDALPGRMETIELWPLFQGEIDGVPDRFIDSAFEHGPQLRFDGTENRDDYIERIARGGFPEAVAREGKRRSRFFSSYVADLINRDVMQLSEIERSAEMFTLANLVAARSGQLLVPGALGNELGLPKDTVARYLRLLEEVFLIKRIPAWSRNLTTRAVATSKVFMVDSGIATYLCGADPRASGRERPARTPTGGLRSRRTRSAAHLVRSGGPHVPLPHPRRSAICGTHSHNRPWSAHRHENGRAAGYQPAALSFRGPDGPACELGCIGGWTEHHDPRSWTPGRTVDSDLQ